MIITVAVAVDMSLWSVTVTVYGPAQRPLIVGAVPPPGAQAYANGPVPPVTTVPADPVQPPKHMLCTTLLMVTVWPMAEAFFTNAQKSKARKKVL